MFTPFFQNCIIIFLYCHCNVFFVLLFLSMLLCGMHCSRCPLGCAEGGMGFCPSALTQSSAFLYFWCLMGTRGVFVALQPPPLLSSHWSVVGASVAAQRMRVSLWSDWMSSSPAGNDILPIGTYLYALNAVLEHRQS